MTLAPTPSLPSPVSERASSSEQEDCLRCPLSYVVSVPAVDTRLGRPAGQRGPVGQAGGGRRLGAQRSQESTVTVGSRVAGSSAAMRGP